MSADIEDPAFWLLSYTGQDFRSLEEPELKSRDIVAELDGSAVEVDWRPPKFNVVGTGAWPDWMHYPIPFISDRALDLLRDLVLPCCQVLPVFLGAGRRYNLLNVLAQVPRTNWSSEESSVYGDVIANAEGISIKQSPPPEMFRLEGLLGRVFVSDNFAKRSYRMQLSGALFIDPEIRSMNIPLIASPSNVSMTGFIRRRNEMSG